MLAADIGDVVLVTTRYFGGTKLGTSGLINAYRTAADDCLENANILDYIIKKEFKIQFAYDKMNSVMRIIDEEQVNICEKDFTESCEMKLSVRETACGQVLDRIAKIPGIQLIT